MIRLSPDFAETDPARDELGYAPLAKNIALGIGNLCPPEGIVMAITGGWGVGKTTTINFVKHYLKTHGAPVKVVDFNPWWFSGHEDLVHRLIQSLTYSVDTDTPQKLELVAAFSDLSQILETSPIEHKPQISGFSVDLSKIAVTTAHKVQTKKDVPALKEGIGNLLSTIGMRFLVVVDDVDRLSVEEIRDLFRAIKAVGDLPNVVYLLALDPLVVSRALNQFYPERGTDYLDKMLQVVFDLPVPSAEGIARILIKGLDQLLQTLKVSKFDNERFWLLYRRGLRYQLTSPRQVIRLLNALYVTVPAVAFEVNLAEFVAIESCRLFLPQVYQKIRLHKDQFAGVASHTHRSRDDDGLKSFHEGWIKDLDADKRAWVKDFITELFPKLEFALENKGYSTDFLTKWRKQLRVCSPEIFNVYFSFAEPIETISAQDLSAFLSAIDTDFMTTMLRTKAQSESVQDKNWLWNMLERVRDHVADEITPGQAEKLFATLVSVWADFKDLEGVTPKIAWLPDNSYILSGLLADLLTRMPPANRKAVVINSLQKPFSIEPMLRVVQRLARAHGYFKEPGDDHDRKALVTPEEFEEIRSVYCERVQELIDNDQISDPGDLCRIIYTLVELDPERVQRIVKKLKQSIIGAVALMSYGIQESTGYSTEGGVRKRFLINTSKIETLLPPEDLIEQAKTAQNSELLSARSKQIAEAFLQKVTKTGESIDDDEDDW